MSSPFVRWLKLHVVPLVVPPLVRLHGCTLRRRVRGWRAVQAGVDAGSPILGAFLHGHQGCMASFIVQAGRGPWAVLCSLSEDGEMQHRILSRLGFVTVRGSSSRGGAQALVELAQVMRAARPPRAVMAVDGPRGPYGVPKPGVLKLAALTGAVIHPVAAAVRPSLVLRRAWDRFRVPLPWSRVRLWLGPPIRVPRDLDGEGLERLRLGLQRLLALMEGRLDRMIRHDR